MFIQSSYVDASHKTGSTHFSDNPFLRQFVLPTKLSSLPAPPFSPTCYLRLVFFPFLRHFDTSDNPILRQSCYVHISDKIVKPNSPTKYFFPFLRQLECSHISDKIIFPTSPTIVMFPFLRPSHHSHFSDIFILPTSPTSSICLDIRYL